MSDRAELLAERATIVEQLEDLEFELFAVLSGHDIPRENELKAQIRTETDKLAAIDLRLQEMSLKAPASLTVEQIKSMDERLVSEMFDGIIKSIR